MPVDNYIFLFSFAEYRIVKLTSCWHLTLWSLPPVPAHNRVTAGQSELLLLLCGSDLFSFWVVHCKHALTKTQKKWKPEILKNDEHYSSQRYSFHLVMWWWWTQARHPKIFHFTSVGLKSGDFEGNHIVSILKKSSREFFHSPNQYFPAINIFYPLGQFDQASNLITRKWSISPTLVVNWFVCKVRQAFNIILDVTFTVKELW